MDTSLFSGPLSDYPRIREQLTALLPELLNAGALDQTARDDILQTLERVDSALSVLPADIQPPLAAVIGIKSISLSGTTSSFGAVGSSLGSFAAFIFSGCKICFVGRLGQLLLHVHALDKKKHKKRKVSDRQLMLSKTAAILAALQLLQASVASYCSSREAAKHEAEIVEQAAEIESLQASIDRLTAAMEKVAADLEKK